MLLLWQVENLCGGSLERTLVRVTVLQRLLRDLGLWWWRPMLNTNVLVVVRRRTNRLVVVHILWIGHVLLIVEPRVGSVGVLKR